MLKISKFLMALILPVIFLFSCQEESGPVNPALPFEIQDVNAPAIISSLSGRPVLLTAKVTHPRGEAGIEQVEVLLSDSTGQTVKRLNLYDDGAAVHPQSGDVVAFDKVYSYRVIPTEWGVADGAYSLTVKATSVSGGTLESSAQSLTVYPNQAPEIESLSFPDSIPAGMPDTGIEFTVHDNDGLSDIRWVIMQFVQNGILKPGFTDTIPNPMNNSPLFSKTIDSSFAAGKSGEFEMRFLAEDQAGEKSQPLTRSVQFVNTPPVIARLTIPDTMFIPAAGAYVDTVRALVTDRQSPADIRTVTFTSQIRRTDGTLGEPSEPIALYDNGDLAGVGDPTAGDGEFSRIIQLGPGNTPGTYIFTFSAEDRVGQASGSVTDSVTVTY